MRRRGFTLVEMLVVLALTVFLMSIISTAFVTGLEAFRRLKGIAEMDRDLTQAGNQLRRDLRSAHFDGDVRLSELTPGSFPEQGFFHYSESNPDPLLRQVIYENLDFAATPPPPNGTARRYFNDRLQFTVRLSGNRPTDFFQAKLAPGSGLTGTSGHADGRYQPPGTYASQWAVVSYWLGSSAGPGVPLPEDAGASELAQDPVFANYPGGHPPRVQLYNLYCRRQLLVPDHFTTPNGLVDRPTPTAADLDSDISVFPGSVGPPPMPAEFNSAVDIRDPARRVTAPLTGARMGEDILIPNVLSFDVKYWNGADFVDLPTSSYDTAIAGGPPAGTFRALQIKIRVYHPKTQQTREITLIVDL